MDQTLTTVDNFHELLKKNKELETRVMNLEMQFGPICLGEELSQRGVHEKTEKDWKLTSTPIKNFHELLKKNKELETRVMHLEMQFGPTSLGEEPSQRGVHEKTEKDWKMTSTPIKNLTR